MRSSFFYPEIIFLEHINVAIPLHGKMIFRSLHSAKLVQEFRSFDINPIFFVEKKLLPVGNEVTYAELLLEHYQKIQSKPFMLLSSDLRWFMLKTQSTETRLRDHISNSIWASNNIFRSLSTSLLLSLLRYMKFIGPAFIAGENFFFPTKDQIPTLINTNTSSVLISGIGNRDFHIGGFFAREAFKLKLPVISYITNYDNLLSKGYRGFTPDRLVVWSKKMADQANTLMDIPKRKISIAGPSVFDRYFLPLNESRESFLIKRGLDPESKTIFYAGHTSIVTYFDFLNLVYKLKQKGEILEGCNLIIRPYPHTKVYNWSGLQTFIQEIKKLPQVYVSNPLETSADNFSETALKEDLHTSTDELHAILKYSDLLVNYFSTVGLEAAICDLPTIHIAYDKFTYQISPIAWSKTGAINTHNQDQLRRSASIVVYSDDELILAMQKYLNHPELHRDERYAYALSECQFLDGKSTNRLAEIVSEITKPHIKSRFGYTKTYS